MAYLASRGELKWSESRLEIWDIGLEFVERGRNGLLELGRLDARWRVGGNLVKSGLKRHVCDCV